MNHIALESILRILIIRRNRGTPAVRLATRVAIARTVKNWRQS